LDIVRLLVWTALMYRLRRNKMSQRENRDIDVAQDFTPNFS